MIELQLSEEETEVLQLAVKGLVTRLEYGGDFRSKDDILALRRVLEKVESAQRLAKLT